MPLLADHLYSASTVTHHQYHQSHIQNTTPLGGGLLTTVENLPAPLKRQYSSAFKPKSAAIRNCTAFLLETPLDLTVKSQPSHYTQQQQFQFASITPPSTPSPPKKRYKFIVPPSPPPPLIDEIHPLEEETIVKEETIIVKEETTVVDEPAQTTDRKERKSPKQVTPKKPIQRSEKSEPKMGKVVRQAAIAKQKQQSNIKRSKVTKKLKFDEETSSPVSGTIIRRLEEIEDEDQIGDIDPEYNIVEVTEEAKAEIAAIANVIGDYVCKLCRKLFEDAFELARHRCSCIVLLEYRCPECGKRFNCPANLASHRRWHKPRDQARGGAKGGGRAGGGGSGSKKEEFACSECNKSFKRLAYLKKHQLVHKNSKEERELEPMNHYSISNESFEGMNTRGEEENMRSGVEEEEEQVVYHHPTKLQTFTQIVFRYASNSDDEIIYNPISRGSTPISMCSAHSATSPRPQQTLYNSHREVLTEDENLAAAALAALGHHNSVIRHTTLSV